MTERFALVATVFESVAVLLPPFGSAVLEVTVTVTWDGAPQTFIYEQERQRITQIFNRWRVQTQWWEETAVTRDYYQVETDMGMVAVLYRDREAGGWFLERVYD